MSPRYLFALIALVACDAKGGGEAAGTGSGAKVAESGTKRGSAGGFSAGMGQELGPPEGSLGAAAPGAVTSTAPAASGSASSAEPSGAAANGAAPGAAANGAAPSGAAPSGAAPSGAAPSGAAPSGSAGAGSAGAAAPMAAQGSAPAAEAADAKVPAGAAAAPAAPDKAAVAAAPDKAAVAAAPADAPKGSLSKRAPVKPSAELAAIKFDLEPNWDRDVGEAGTFSLVVKVPSTDEMRVFSVRYGYDDPAAPFDCDQYRGFLEDKKLMKVTVNRQRGAACYIEGTDPNGAASYRYLVNYGGKRLLCHGSLYKDAASASLGDLRDKVLMQAKKICETLAL